jgi:hypothetical protein
MVERMIVDILKWIVIILIFFIAFACSLFLIFSHFAISLQQQKEFSPDVSIYEFEDDGTCSRTENYDKIASVGSYPAIHYFGQSFGATILTTFFTLFGVIGEDNVAARVSMC